MNLRYQVCNNISIMLIETKISHTIIFNLGVVLEFFQKSMHILKKLLNIIIEVRVESIV